MNRSVHLLALATLAVVLVGCSTSVPTPGSTTSPTTTPTEAAQLPETGESRPAAAFEGDCDAVLSEDQRTGIFGVAGTSQSHTYPQPFGYLPEQLGGASCRWHEGDDSTPFVFDVYGAVIPLGSLAGQLVEPSECGEHPSGSVECVIAASANGLLLSARVSFPDATAIADAQAAADAVTATFEENAAAQTGFRPPLQNEDSWPLAASCSDIEGLGTLEAAEMESYVSPAEHVLWGDRLTLSCGDGDGLVFAFLGGAAWVGSELDGAAIDIPGVDKAIVSNNGDSVEVFTGVNWLQVWYSGDNRDTVIPGIVAALDAL